jgi:hypothetical protein
VAPIPVDDDLDENEFQDVREYHSPPSGSGSEPIGVEDYVRAPIQPKKMRLVDPAPPPQAYRQILSDSVFENLASIQPDDPDFVIQGIY